MTEQARSSLDEMARTTGAAPDGRALFQARMTTPAPGAAVPWITNGTVGRTTLETVAIDADVARVKVVSPLGASEIRMRREAGAWRVDLDVR